MVGVLQLQDVIGGKEGWKATLIVEVAAFDFTFGLRCWCIAQGHTVKMESCSQLGKGLRSVSEKEGMIVYVKGQRQTTGTESSLQEVQVGQEGFGPIEPGTHIKTSRVVQQI